MSTKISKASQSSDHRVAFDTLVYAAVHAYEKKTLADPERVTKGATAGNIQDHAIILGKRRRDMSVEDFSLGKIYASLNRLFNDGKIEKSFGYRRTFIIYRTIGFLEASLARSNELRTQLGDTLASARRVMERRPSLRAKGGWMNPYTISVSSVGLIDFMSDYRSIQRENRKLEAQVESLLAEKKLTSEDYD